jgi:hypothetical protein
VVTVQWLEARTKSLIDGRSDACNVDHFTRRLVGFGVHRGAVDGVGLCRLFNRATRGHAPPKYVSSDHDRLFQFHQWQANLRILDVEEIKTVPWVPLSHPFVERLIGPATRRRCVVRVSTAVFHALE